MLVNALPVALVNESFGYLAERLAFRGQCRCKGSATNCRVE